MLHELRIYRAMPGKLVELHKRFEMHTINILKKHGIRPTGFWTTLIGESSQDIYWMIEWKSLAEREEKWHALSEDPEWIAIKTETEANGPLIEFQRNMMLAQTPTRRRCNAIARGAVSRESGCHNDTSAR